MKFSIVATLALAGFNSHANAFTSPKALGGRSCTKLDVTTLEEWQLLDNGSVVGSVRGHPSLSDGDIITTSPLSSPLGAQSEGTVTTLTGSQYKLGTPMQLKTPSAAAVDPGMDRSSFLTSAGLVSLFAGGVAVGVGVSGSGEKSSGFSVPEVRLTEIILFVKSLQFFFLRKGSQHYLLFLIPK